MGTGSTLSLADILPIPVPLDILDIGCRRMTVRNGDRIEAQRPVYQDLLDRGLARVIGFDADPSAVAALQATAGPNESYVALALGDGASHRLHLCALDGMSSLYEPDPAVMDRLHLHGAWSQVVATCDIPTVRLDDVPGLGNVDFIKIDVQGAEVMILANAAHCLADCLVVHSEAMFVPMYRDQPLLAEQDLLLRRHGFWIHRLIDIASHALKPLMRNNDPHGPFSQVFQCDVVFARAWTGLAGLSDDKLVKLALILHDFYGSADLVYQVLAERDRRRGSDDAGRYVAALTAG